MNGLFRARTVVGVSGAGLLAVALAACGGSDGGDGGAKAETAFEDLSATKIFEAAVESSKTVTAVKAEGTMPIEGKEVTLSVQNDDKGNCMGSITEGGGRADIVILPEGQYLKADETFWNSYAGGEAQAKAVLALLKGKWAKLPAAEKGFEQFCVATSMLEGVKPVGKDERIAEKKGDVAEVGGVRAVELVDPDSKNAMWVAVDEPHYVVQIEGGAKDPGSMVFTEQNKPVPAKAPAKGDVVDLGQLG